MTTSINRDRNGDFIVNVKTPDVNVSKKFRSWEEARMYVYNLTGKIPDGEVQLTPDAHSSAVNSEDTTVE